MSAAIRAGQAFVEFYGDNTRLFRSMRNAEKRLKRFGGVTRAAGAKLLGIGVAASVPFALAAKTFAGFEEQMSAVKAVTGANGKQFASLTSMAEKLGATTQFTASQAAEGMKFLGMAGFDTEQILAGIPAVLSLAKAGAVDLAIASDIASDISSAFGLSADEIGRVADVMAATAAKANTSVELMGESFKFVAPLAATAEQEIEGIASAIGVLGNNAIKGSTAGTDLANMFKNLAAKQDKVKDEFGVDVGDAEGNFRPLVDILDDIGKSMIGLSNTEQLKRLTDLFGGRAVKSAAILIDNIDAIRELGIELENSQGAAKRMADIMADNLAGSAKTLLSALEAVQIQVGKALSPTLREVMGVMSDIARTTAIWAEANPQVIIGLASLTAGTAALGAAMVTAGIGISLVGSAFGLLLNPLFLAVGALAVGAAAWLNFSESGQAASAILSKTVAGLGEVFKTTFGGIVDSMQGGDLLLAGEIFREGLTLAFLKTKKAVLDIWLQLGEGLMNLIADTADSIPVMFESAMIVAGNFWREFSAGFNAVFLVQLGMAADKLADLLSFASKLNPLGEAILKKIGLSTLGETALDLQDFRDSAFSDARIGMQLASKNKRELPERPLDNSLPPGSISEIVASQRRLRLLTEQSAEINAPVFGGLDPFSREEFDAIFGANNQDEFWKDWIAVADTGAKDAVAAAQAALGDIGVDPEKLGKGFEAADEKFSPTGATSAAAALLLGGTLSMSPMEKVANEQLDEQKQANKHLRKLVSQEPVLAFAGGA